METRSLHIEELKMNELPDQEPTTSLARNLVWFALGLLVSGGIGTVALLQFLESRVKAEIRSPEMITLIASQNPVAAIPKGALLLFAGGCPAGIEDMTSTMNGRYIYIDQTATSNVTLYEDDGSHVHEGGAHSHPVSGQAGPLGGGERSGTRDSLHAAHKDNIAPVTGTAHPAKSAHTHTGGSHQHKRVGLRLCKL
jgi:hypothetical protein